MFNWHDYISFGEELLGEKDECSRRVAVSRIYYGLFNLAKRKMSGSRYNDLKDSNSPIGFHQLFWRNFFIRDDEYSTKMLLKTDVLRSTRNVADYDSSSHEFNCKYKKYIEVYRDVEKAIKDSKYVY